MVPPTGEVPAVQLVDHQPADFPGEGPGQFLPELTGNDCTSASVESELALLWQDLTAGEAGNANDSRADGVIFNPYTRNTRSILTLSNQFILSTSGTADNLLTARFRSQSGDFVGSTQDSQGLNVPQGFDYFNCNF